jgi:AcrR family transcriptional regulator
VVFARAGFGSAKLREIAEAADVNPALIGYHFHTKEGLYLAAFEVLYEGLIVRGHRALAKLVQRLRQGEDTANARLLAATIFSQVLVIRISRTPLIRLMGWDGIGNQELEALKTLVRRNTTLLVLGA